MEEIEDADFYLKLTKKRLQVLCKRNGLSPHKTKSDLANSLSTFFKKKNLSSVPPIESSVVDSVTGVSIEMIPVSKDIHVKISCDVEEENKVNDSRATKCDEDRRLTRSGKCLKAPCFGIIQGPECPNNEKKNSTLVHQKKAPLSSLSVLGRRGKSFDCRGGPAIVIRDKDNILSNTEAGENIAAPIRTKNLISDLALERNVTADLEKSSKDVSSFEFHTSIGKGINLIVDLNASPSDLCKRLKNEVCNCYCAHSSGFQSFREELKLLGRSSSKIYFSDIACQQEKVFYLASSGVVPMESGKGNNESVFSESNDCAEEQEHADLDGVDEASVNTHSKMSLKEKPVIQVGETRKRPSSERKQRLLSRRMRHTQRVLPRRSMRLLKNQEF